MKKVIFLYFAMLSAVASQAQETFYPDSTFGINGNALLPTTKLEGGNTILLPDGKLLIYGEKLLDSLNYHGTHYLARVNPDGTLDSGFGVGGELVIPNDLTYYFTALVAHTLADGSLILGADGYGLDTFGRITLTRCLPDGKVDSTFGVNGVCMIEDRTPDRQYDLYLQSVVIGKNGKMYVGVDWSDFEATEPPYSQDRVYCVLPSGKVDSTFGTNGYFVLTDTLGFYLGSINIDSEDNFYMYASDYLTNGPSELHFLKMNSQMSTILDVNLNTLFSDDYLYVYSAFKPVLQPDGKILMIIEDYPYNIVARLLPNGTLDPTFNKTGYYSGSFNQTGGSLRFLTNLTDGKIIALGNYDRLLIRMNQNGTPDLSLGLTGSSSLIRPGTGSFYYSFGLISGNNNNSLIKAEVLDRRIYLSKFFSKKCSD